MVWIETWPSRSCICSSSPPAAWHNLGAGPSQVMRRKLVDSGLRGELMNDVPNNFLGHAFARDPTGSIHATKQSAGSNSRSGQPNIKDLFHAVRHRYGPHMTGLPDEIDNGPVYAVVSRRQDRSLPVVSLLGHGRGLPRS